MPPGDESDLFPFQAVYLNPLANSQLAGWQSFTTNSSWFNNSEFISNVWYDASATNEEEMLFRGKWLPVSVFLEALRKASKIKLLREILPTRVVDLLHFCRLEIKQPCWSANRWKSKT